MRKYCAMDYVFLVTVKGREKSADPEWSQFRVEVEKPYKKPPRGKKASRGLRLRRGKHLKYYFNFYVYPSFLIFVRLSVSVSVT